MGHTVGSFVCFIAGRYFSLPCVFLLASCHVYSGLNLRTCRAYLSSEKREKPFKIYLRFVFSFKA